MYSDRALENHQKGECLDCAYPFIFQAVCPILNPCLRKRAIGTACGQGGKGGLRRGGVLVFCGNGINVIRRFSLEAGRSGFPLLSVQT